MKKKLSARLVELKSKAKKSKMPHWIDFSDGAIGRDIIATCSCGSTRLVRLESVLYSQSCKCRVLFKNKHGKTGSQLHVLWQNIKARTLNVNDKAYFNYGGRGIKIYDEWKDDFVKFASYVVETLGERPSKKHSLDRIDNNGDYCPANIRWADAKKQRSNSRRIRPITFNGETLPLKQICDKYGINRATFKDRLKSGWSVADALTVPRLKSGHHRKRLKGYE